MAAEAQRLNLTTQTKFLFKILSCSKRQQAAVLLLEKQEATAELSIVYNKIIIFSRESEALLKDHTGTRMQHRQQEVALWDFPCEEIA